MGNKIFAERLRQVMFRKDLVQKELADRLGVPIGTVGRWARGETVPNADHAAALSRELGVSMDYLYGFTDDPAIQTHGGFDPKDPNWRDHPHCPELLLVWADDPDVGPMIENDARVRAILSGVIGARGLISKKHLLSFLEYALYVIEKDEKEVREEMRNRL